MNIPVLSLQIDANVVAWYGAILATASLAIAVLNYLRDRKRIKVRISNGVLLPDPWGGDSHKIFIAAENHGRRVVTLSQVGFRLSDETNLILPNPKNISFPYKLNEGESVSTFFEKTDLLKQIASGKTIKFGWYRDAVGDVYKCKFNVGFLK